MKKTEKKAGETLPVKENAMQASDWKVSAASAFEANQRHPLKIEKTDTDEGLQTTTSFDETLLRLYETTGIADFDAAVRLLSQAMDAQPHSKEIEQKNQAAALLNALAPQTPLEGLLCTQMVSTHNMAAAFSCRAMAENQTTENVESNLNRANKLMRLFTAQVEALHKLRNKGQQRIIVQHVQVNDGGQAVIGDITPGGGGKGS